MKFLLSFFAYILLLNLSQGQNLKLERIDSVNKSKEQIYNDTKLFIVENWRSANDVIQLDDKNAGIIIVKGITNNPVTFQMKTYENSYSHTVKFMIKENKCRVIIENVIPLKTFYRNYELPLIDACENCEFPGYTKTWISASVYIELQNDIKNKLNNILNNYFEQIKKPSIVNDDW